MAQLKLPNELDSAFKAYFALDAKTRLKIVGLVNEIVSVQRGALDLEEALIKQLKLSKDNSVDITRMIFSLVAGESSTGANFRSFISDVADVLTTRDIIAPEGFHDEMSNMQNAVSQRIKAIRLAHERGKLLKNSLIITDIRPVFADSDTDSISGMSIIHTLKISYSENGKTQTSFLAVNNDDLAMLKDQIERAEMKEQTIRETLKSSDIQFINIKNG